MSVWVALKVFADVCLCFGIMGSFPNLFSHSFVLIWPAVLCGLGAGIAVFFAERGRFSLRFMGLLPIAGMLLLADDTGDWIVLLPALVYSTVVIIRGDLTLEYYGFRQYFKNSAIGLGLFFLLMSGFAYMEKVTDPTRGSFYMDAMLQYGSIYLLTGVMLQRQLRLGTEEQKNGRILNRLQMAAILGCLAGVSAMVILIKESLWESVADLLGKVLAVLTMPLWLLFSLFDGEIKDFEEDRATGVTGGLTIPHNTGTMPSLGDGVIEKPPVQPESDFPWFLLLMLVIIVIVMILFTKSFHYRRSARIAKETLNKLEKAEKEQFVSPQSNRGKIRKYYRDFLKAERKRGVKLYKHQTSADILQNLSIDTNRQAAASLRELYVAARYDPEAQITDEQVKQAKSALKKCKEN